MSVINEDNLSEYIRANEQPALWFVDERNIGPQLIGRLIKIQAFQRGEEEKGESVLVADSLQDYVGFLQSYVRSKDEWLFFFEGGMNITFYKENQHFELHVI